MKPKHPQVMGDDPQLNPGPKIRPAAPPDVPLICQMVRELADFEHLLDQVRLSAEDLQTHLFGAKPVVEAVVAECDGQVVAFALYFTNFSTFLGRPGLYLEDLYVRPAFRSRGVGLALMRHLGATAAQRGYGRFEWSVLDWNQDAIQFYERLGATVMQDWRICRITGETLRAFGESG